MAFCTIFVCMYINKDISLYNYMYAWCVVNSLFFNDFVIICLFVIYISFQVSLPSDSKSRRSHWCSVFPAASFLFLIFFAVYAFIAPDYKEVINLVLLTLNFQYFFKLTIACYHRSALIYQNGSLICNPTASHSLVLWCFFYLIDKH